MREEVWKKIDNHYQKRLFVAVVYLQLELLLSGYCLAYIFMES